MTDTPPHPLAARFAQFVAFLLEGIGECGLRRQIAGPLTFRLERRFNKMARRFAALLAHLAEFGVDAPRRACHRKQPPPAVTSPDPAPVPAPAQVPPPRLRIRTPRRAAPPTARLVPDARFHPAG